MGSGYSISFEITYPTTVTLDPVVSDSFAVGGRPISVKVTALPTLHPLNEAFTVNVTAWDDALDQPATLDKLPTVPVTCEIVLFGATEGVMTGTTSAVMTDGVATFDDLTIDKVEEGIYVNAVCEDQADFSKQARSEKFNIHPYPETGLLQETDTGFTYKGSIKYVQSVLTAYENLLTGNGKSYSSAPKTLGASEDEEKVFISPEIIEMWPEI